MRHICGNVGSSLLTALYLKLAEEGVLGIDDPVAKFVPSLGIPKADKITLRMLASGTSGIEHFPGMDSFQKAFYQNPFRTWDPRELVGYGISVPLLFEPGTNWHFSDTNLVILGLCIESATGQKVQDLITARWLRPLNMTSSYMPWNPSIPDPVLHSYTSERGVYEEATFWNPQWISFPGHLICQQDDVRTWMEALNGGRVLSPASLKTLLSYPGFGFGPNPQKYYGMGTGVWSNWTFTNPSLQGLRGAVGRHEQGDATVVIFNTVSPASDQEAHQATPAFVKVAEALGLPVWMP
ncbi:beta-lactamase/transpeptidase-like protein [Hyaloraphidium curvatum]|nr:beta-lactamase/transpeptidase-like protein [Hyaloraphidium curvatum]